MPLLSMVAKNIWQLHQFLSYRDGFISKWGRIQLEYPNPIPGIDPLIIAQVVFMKKWECFELKKVKQVSCNNQLFETLSNISYRFVPDTGRRTRQESLFQDFHQNLGSLCLLRK